MFRRGKQTRSKFRLEPLEVRMMLSGVAIYALSNFLSKSMSADTPAATV